MLESKVGSKLTLAQLRRYRTDHAARATHLIAITKNRPEVPNRTLKAERIHAIRWQDVHRALTGSPVPGRVDRFIVDSFVEYLEDVDMAYRERLTLGQLEQAGRVISAVHHSDPQLLSVKDAFRSLHNCAGLLSDLSKDVREEVPALAKFSRLGPAYFCEETTGGQMLHTLGVVMWRGSGQKFRSIGWGFSFGRMIAVQWSLWRYVGDDEVQANHAIRRYLSSGTLDADILLRSIREHIRKWRVA